MKVIESGEYIPPNMFFSHETMDLFGVHRSP